MFLPELQETLLQGESCPAGTTKDYQSSGDAQHPPNVRMTIDEGSGDSEADAHRYAQGAIYSPHIQNHRHIASAVRRFMQDCCNASQRAWFPCRS